MPAPNTAAKRFARRKAPRQRRSRSTVESITDATLELIGDEGFALLSTGRIAERAGVSIGSLYQYFPNREAILLALYEDASSKLAENMRGLLVQIIDKPVEEAVRAVIANLLKLHGQHRLILLELVAQMPELRLTAHPVSFENLIRGSMRIFLEQRSPRLTALERERKLFFVEQVLLGSVRRYVSDPPPRMSTRAFVADLVRIVAPYLDVEA